MHQMGRKRPVFHRDGFNRPIRGIPHIFAVVSQHHDGAHIGAAHLENLLRIRPLLARQIGRIDRERRSILLHAWRFER